MVQERRGGRIDDTERQLLEEHSRHLARETACERVRAAAMAMSSADDLLQVAAVLYREVLDVGIRAFGVSVEFFDSQSPDSVLAHYNVWPNPRRLGIGWSSPDVVELGEDAIGHVWLTSSEDTYQEIRARRGEQWAHVDSAEASWRMWRHVEDELGFERHLQPDEWPEPRIEARLQAQTHVTHIPFDHGNVAVRTPDTVEEHLDTVQAMAASLSLGFVRYLDFQRLEAQNRQLTLDRAVERVRAEATAMRGSADIGRVMAEPVRGRLLVQEDAAPGLDLYRSLDLDLAFARERGWAQPDLAASLWEAPATFPEDLEALWGHRSPDWDRFIGCSGINVPFAYGGVFAQAPAGHLYSEADVANVERFAGAVSLGYTRFLDLQAAEARAAEQARGAAIGRVRAAAMSMRATEDLRDVVIVLWQEMVGLGVDTPGCNIVFLDEESGRVIEYMALKNPRGAGATWTSPAIVEIDDDTIVFAIDTTLTHYLEGGPMPYSFSLGADPGSILQTWQERQVWSAAFDEEMMVQTSAALGMSALAPWDRGEWVGTAVAFRYGKVGYRVQTPTADHADLVRDLTQALELGYLRFLDFQRLEEQNRQIQETTRHKSEFLSRMSHDLRTPMNAILGYTRILLRRARGVLDERQLRNLENIQTSADNLLALINEILDLSRIEAGRVEIHPESVDLRGLIAGCVATVATLVKPGVELVEELDEVAPVRTDAERVRRIVMNLLGNAVKFTEAGRITVSLRTADGGCELAVADTGVGIPGEDLPHIFEEFHQVERSVGAKREGTGLGLAIAQRSAQMLGGHITAVSEVGRGSTFTLRLGGHPG